MKPILRIALASCLCIGVRNPGVRAQLSRGGEEVVGESMNPQGVSPDLGPRTRSRRGPGSEFWTKMRIRILPLVIIE